MTVVQRRLSKEKTRVVTGTGSEGAMVSVMLENGKRNASEAG